MSLEPYTTTCTHPERQPRIHDLCRGCYNRWLYHNNPLVRQTVIKLSNKWHKANPEKAKLYQTRYRQRHPEAIREKNRRHEQRHREHIREQSRLYRLENKDHLKIINARWRALHPRHRHRVERFGLTHQQYDSLVVAQNGLCAICGKNENGKRPKRLSIDHNHVTKIVRGLLCLRCNVKLGILENQEWVKLALLYLADPPAPKVIRQTTMSETSSEKPPVENSGMGMA